MRFTAMTFLFNAIVLLSSLPCVAQKPAATLQIQLHEKEFKSGAAIRLDVIVTNLSGEDLRIWKVSAQVDGQAEAYLSVNVCDSEGKPLSRIDGVTIERNGKKYRIGKAWITRKGVMLSTNHELRDFLSLSALFNLSKPGTYTASAAADIPEPYSGPEIKWIVAKSNKVSFEVK